ncbi:MAG: M24 family metallopeptidase [Terriglobia bacterium]
MQLSRRQFVGWLGGSALAGAALAKPRFAGAFPSESPTFGNPSMRASIERALKTVKIPSLQPPFRLGEPWHRATVARLQTHLRDRGLAGVLCANHLNHNYLAGYFLTRTERPMFLFIPARGEPSFFHPGLDRDLVSSWWIKDNEWYFDFHHAGAYNKIQWKAGKKEDLWIWAAKNLAKRGYGKGKLGLDREAVPSLAKKLKETLPEVDWVNLEKDLLHMRQIKTPEEIKLTQKAIDLHDAMLAFARSYILEHGTAATDYDVRIATSEFGTRKLMEVLGPELDARPHTGVGLALGFGCRTGPATAYPHPNQFFFRRIQKGDAIQIASLIRIGGYGGEGYRACHIEPIPDLGKKMWEVHTEMTRTQAELCRVGTRCNQVAEKVLTLALNAGLEKYVYHRPAHGEGMEGHQAPWIALGDDTVLEENMMFSNEPGLYNSEGGFGYNHSNNVRVARDRGVIMNQTPFTKKWCWLKL